MTVKNLTYFQSFTDAQARKLVAGRIAALRHKLSEAGVEGLFVPRSDEHQSEYVPPCDERLAWLTGFTGSAGSAIILKDKAALIVDGRYTLQAADQTDTSVITPVEQARTSAEAWLSANLPSGTVFGYDPRLLTSKQVERLRKAAEKAGGRIRALDVNPIDAIWHDRPERPHAAVKRHPDALAGATAVAKVQHVQAALLDAALDALLVSDPHALAWLFNIRGGDVAHTPLPLGYALVPANGLPTLFMDPAKLDGPVQAWLATQASLATPDDLNGTLIAIARKGRRIRCDEATCSSRLAALITDHGGQLDLGADPIAMMKARKSDAEIEGARAAHRRDGVAVARFLNWLGREAVTGGVSEIDAVCTLESFRRETNQLKDISFPTISGSGPNGAIVHYRVTEGTNRRLQPGELFLIDSGGQYEDGTTDITRTLAIGTPSAEMKDRFTRVLKGHIAIATAIFPAGTSGAQIDAFARRPLWEAGLDFDHGTGHGVGSYLSVHEGPQRISKLGTVALEPGMILSNEPGYYKAGEYGIRIENLILVEKRTVTGGDRDMLGFETLTLAPIDRTLVEPSLLDTSEIAWLDAYHARVRAALTPLLDEDTARWLEAATRPLQA